MNLKTNVKDLSRCRFMTMAGGAASPVALAARGIPSGKEAGSANNPQIDSNNIASEDMDTDKTKISIDELTRKRGNYQKAITACLEGNEYRVR